LKGCI